LAADAGARAINSAAAIAAGVNLQFLTSGLPNCAPIINGLTADNGLK
jgi:hypothetical protein